MNINLKNIGIISDSEIEVKGLTVIVGHNNSGKTTVGKVLYSLVDAVSNIERKAANDKYNYVLEQLYNANKEFACRVIMNKSIEAIPEECLRIFFAENYRVDIGREDIETYLVDLIDALKVFSIKDEPYKSIINEDPRSYIFEEILDYDVFIKEREEARILLEDTLAEITKDPMLVNYAKQSINEILSVEFSGQIQPVALENIFSKIEMTDGKKKCFSLELYDDEIVKSDDPVFYWSPYKNTFFIDNPFIVGEPIFRRFTPYTKNRTSYVDEIHILSHENKLKTRINRFPRQSVFKAGLIEEKYKAIKEKIDNILPGDFVMTSKGQYYIHNGVELKAANLATGSKMFSIIKLLLAKGDITDKTLLILDEPEAHLHPKWQNLFAEIMVMLVKELGCHILLTTHSPNFMLALEANMRKYDAIDICNFYQTKYVNDTMFVNYKCVNNSLEDIYEDFVTYLSDMKQLRDNYL